LSIVNDSESLKKTSVTLVPFSQIYGYFGQKCNFFPTLCLTPPMKILQLEFCKAAWTLKKAIVMATPGGGKDLTISATVSAHNQHWTNNG